jgi:hypothetical protein
MKQALIDAAKEGMRVVVIAIIPILIDGLSKDALDLKVIGVVAAIAALRFVDKFLHENSKLESPDKRNEGLFGVKGLTGF